uniref:Uncharacterized protein n=1 Tax=Aliivibrio fischeri TaxID=668 RepID=H2ES81_ALIFS|nr:hypothetical protein [Aliivibrio fischeri]
MHSYFMKFVLFTILFLIFMLRSPSISMLGFFLLKKSNQ